MSTPPPQPGERDDSADTQMFRKFVEDAEGEPGRRPVGVPFRVATLLIGLVVFAGLVYLLLKL